MLKFYKCEGCGNFITFLAPKTACTPKCCGETMAELLPNSSDGAFEKHLPVISIEEDLVTINVGSVEHPMTNEHYIEWIILETANGYIKKDLHPEDKPMMQYKLIGDEKVISAYIYCNLHGLYKKDI